MSPWGALPTSDKCFYFLAVVDKAKSGAAGV